MPDDACGAISTCSSSQVAQNPQGNNPITVPAGTTSTGKQVLQPNPARAEVIVQNIGTNVVYIGLGFAPDVSSYSFALKAGTALDDGTGGAFSSIVWKGAIFAVAGGGVAGKIAITEEQ